MSFSSGLFSAMDAYLDAKRREEAIRYQQHLMRSRPRPKGKIIDADFIVIEEPKRLESKHKSQSADSAGH